MTPCNKPNSFLENNSLSLDKKISLEFDGGNVTSDGGALLLAAVDRQMGLTARISVCIKDERQHCKIEHTISEMVLQSVYQIGCGYEDCNDAQSLRKDPAMKMATGKCPENDAYLGSQPTLSRFENIDELQARDNLIAVIPIGHNQQRSDKCHQGRSL